MTDAIARSCEKQRSDLHLAVMSPQSQSIQLSLFLKLILLPLIATFCCPHVSLRHLFMSSKASFTTKTLQNPFSFLSSTTLSSNDLFISANDSTAHCKERAFLKFHLTKVKRLELLIKLGFNSLSVPAHRGTALSLSTWPTCKPSAVSKFISSSISTSENDSNQFLQLPHFFSCT